MIWFEIIPGAITDNEIGLVNVGWNSEMNDKAAQRYIIRLARLLTHFKRSGTNMEYLPHAGVGLWIHAAHNRRA
jgi:hypothetical protein